MISRLRALERISAPVLASLTVTPEGICSSTARSIASLRPIASSARFRSVTSSVITSTWSPKIGRNVTARHSPSAPATSTSDVQGVPAATDCRAPSTSGATRGTSRQSSRQVRPTRASRGSPRRGGELLVTPDEPLVPVPERDVVRHGAEDAVEEPLLPVEIGDCPDELAPLLPEPPPCIWSSSAAVSSSARRRSRPEMSQIERAPTTAPPFRMGAAVARTCRVRPSAALTTSGTSTASSPASAPAEGISAASRGEPSGEQASKTPTTAASVRPASGRPANASARSFAATIRPAAS